MKRSIAELEIAEKIPSIWMDSKAKSSDPRTDSKAKSSDCNLLADDLEEWSCIPCASPGPLQWILKYGANHIVIFTPIMGDSSEDD